MSGPPRKELSDLLFGDFFCEIGEVDEDADPVPSNLFAGQSWILPSCDRDMGLSGLHHVDWLGVVFPQEIDVGTGVRFFKGVRQCFNGGVLRSVAGDHQTSCHFCMGQRREARESYDAYPTGTEQSDDHASSLVVET